MLLIVVVFVLSHYVSLRSKFRVMMSVAELMSYLHKNLQLFVAELMSYLHKNLQLFVAELMSYLRYLCVLAHSSISWFVCLRLTCPMFDCLSGLSIHDFPFVFF
jgi:hypothetical protein